MEFTVRIDLIADPEANWWEVGTEPEEILQELVVAALYDVDDIEIIGVEVDGKYFSNADS